MSAAAGPVISDAVVKAHFLEHVKAWSEENIANPKAVGVYDLVFSIDGAVIKTKVFFKAEKPTEFEIQIGSAKEQCILISVKRSDPVTFAFWGSTLFADSAVNKCFDPLLSKSTLPFGAKPADVLAVLLTKLKLVLFPIAILYNAATIQNIEEEDRGYFSLWRLLQGEKSLYEKYGYQSSSETYGEPVFDIIRERATKTTIRELLFQAYSMDQRMLAEFMNLARTHYNRYFTEDIGDLTVSELMKKIPYEEINKQVPGKKFSDFEHKYLINYFLFFLLEKKKWGEINIVTLDPSSETWKTWDSRLQLLSFERSGAAGGRRRTRRLCRSHRLCRRRISRKTK